MNKLKTHVDGSAKRSQFKWKILCSIAFDQLQKWLIERSNHYDWVKNYKVAVYWTLNLLKHCYTISMCVFNKYVAMMCSLFSVGIFCVISELLKWYFSAKEENCVKRV